MAIVYCDIDTGVQSYVAHATFSTTPDPYPNGATIGNSSSTGKLANLYTDFITANAIACGGDTNTSTISFASGTVTLGGGGVKLSSSDSSVSWADIVNGSTGGAVFG